MSISYFDATFCITFIFSLCQLNKEEKSRVEQEREREREREEKRWHKKYQKSKQADTIKWSTKGCLLRMIHSIANLIFILTQNPNKSYKKG